MSKSFKKVAGLGLTGYGGAVAVNGFNTAAVVGGAFGAGAMAAGGFGVVVGLIGLKMLTND